MSQIDSYRHQGMRKKLVEQLASKGIRSREVLDAIAKVPRHFFFDAIFTEHAYQDKAFPIGEGQTISQPYTVAYQTELLNIKKNDKVLEIGTGSGYQTCILLEMGAKVFSIERQPKLFESAKALLHSMNYTARFFCGDGSKGIPAFAPFDKIIVTAGAPVIPETLIEQLKPRGKMVIPVGNAESQFMNIIEKEDDGSVRTQVLDKFKFVPLLGENAW